MKGQRSFLPCNEVAPRCHTRLAGFDVSKFHVDKTKDRKFSREGRRQLRPARDAFLFIEIGDVVTEMD